MALSEDLISFELIEEHKENIQSLPQGRSAKALAATFASPSPFSPAPTPGATRNLNDAIRHEYEIELAAISDSDDPLDIYDRYVKWTVNAYPSAQATAESQLRPLLERATKAFQNVAHYKNDPRYLKLWLSYVRFFSDSPRETFAYLNRHGIGEGLALFYEEFAAWLEHADRWTQAEEVYKLGIEREARPAERLLRKFNEFQRRRAQHPSSGNEPSSPALPTVRPALVAKVDPFAAPIARAADPQAQRLPNASGTSSRSGKQKLAIFSDTDGAAPLSRPDSGDGPRGWESIGTMEERKKENRIEAKPWAGETLKAGKRPGAATKMAIFHDQSSRPALKAESKSCGNYTPVQESVNPRTGRLERVFVDLKQLYPNPEDPEEEYSPEEIRAKREGWMDKQWEKVPDPRSEARSQLEHVCAADASEPVESTESGDAPRVVERAAQMSHTILEASPPESLDNTAHDLPDAPANVPEEAIKPRRKKVKEVKGATQTIRINLDSPSGRPLRRKNSAEPTMTIHTRAATDEILDIFNQPLRNMGGIGGHDDSGGESEDDDDDYTSAGESTGTGRISGATSEFGDDETSSASALPDHSSLPDLSDPKSVSPWSDFNTVKHVPDLDADEEEWSQEPLPGPSMAADVGVVEAPPNEMLSRSVAPRDEDLHTKFIPIPPEDFQVPTEPFRDAAQKSQNRLPFMTPIVEKTETTLGANTAAKDYFNAKTPCRRRGDESPLLAAVEFAADSLASSPFQELLNERAIRPAEPVRRVKPGAEANDPIIKDRQCNPVDESIRETIMAQTQPPLATFPGYHDHRPRTCNKGAEIRRFTKALAKMSKSSDKTTSSLSLPPTLLFHELGSSYTIRRELGKGAYAPVYLAEQSAAFPGQPVWTAIKAEDPPTPWEFYIMRSAHDRLGPSHRAIASLAQPFAMHLFADEGYLVESYHEQGTLLDLVNVAKSDTLMAVAAAAPPPALDEAVAMFFTVELLRTLEALHDAGVLHGDLKADNCLVRLTNPSSSSSANFSSSTSDSDAWSPTFDPSGGHGWAAKGLTLIDFGRGIDLRAFRSDVGFLADWPTTRHDCAAMREMRPWRHHGDYWGAAGVIHVLLFGKWIEDVADKARGGSQGGSVDNSTTTTNNHHHHDHAFPPAPAAEEEALGARARRYRIKESLKRYWQTELWAAVFDVLLNPDAWAAAAAATTTTVEAEADAWMPVRRRLREVREALEAWLVEHAERKGLKAQLKRLEERLRLGR